MNEPAGDAERARAFVAEMIERGVLSFGDFQLKSGRRSPYFFNLGVIADAAGLAALGRAYAEQLRQLPEAPQVLFGPAYKGIPIAAASALALADEQPQLGVAFDRKEAKAHGEGGRLVGAAMQERRVAIVDDVVTDGAAKREAVAAIESAGGRVVGIVLALDRQERMARGGQTAVEALANTYQVPVRCIARLDDVVAFLAAEARYAQLHTRLLAYRSRMAAA